MLPTTGSKITPAICGPCAANACSRPATSLYCSTSVSRLVPAVTPGEFGTRERRGRAAGRDEQAIDVPVVVAGELDDHVAAREAAGQPDRAHRRFGAGADQPHFLDARHGLDDQLGQLVLGRGRCAEARAAAGRLVRPRRRRPDGRGPR